MAELYLKPRPNSRLHLKAPGGSGGAGLWDTLNRWGKWLILMAALFVGILMFVPILQSVQRYHREYNLKQAELQKELEKQKQLVAEIDRLKNDPEYTERLVRDKLGWARPDETLFRFPSYSETSADPADGK